MKISLRKLSEADTKNIVKWRNSEFVRRNLYSQNILTEEQHLNYFRNVVETGKCAQWIIVADDGVKETDIGTVFIKNIDRDNHKGEYGIFIGEDDFRGKGCAYPTTMAILKIAFEELHLNRVYLSVMADNIAAIKAYQKAGFAIEGILKEDFKRADGYVDIVVMGIVKSMWDKVNG